MNTEIRAVARLTFHAGRIEEFAHIAAEVVDRVRAEEPGTLQYDVYIADDMSECVFLERYQDEAALLAHSGALGELLGRMLSTGSIAVDMFGDPTPELRAAFQDMPIRYFQPLLRL